jgi:hypothetical protein
MLSLSKKFLFIHIPKTGGNSLQSLLLPYAEEALKSEDSSGEPGDRFELRNHALGLSKHAPLEDYRAKLDRDVFNGLYKFAVMRNPWERMISYYFSPHRNVTEWNRDEFLKLLSWVPPLRFFVLPHGLPIKIRARLEQVAGVPGRHLDRMVNLIRFENLQEDFSKVCTQLELDLPPLPHRNVSRRKPYLTYYDEELIELVKHRHIEEICFGNYSF